jgi:hypothetical protein
MEDLDRNSKTKNTSYKGVGTVTYQEFFFGRSKEIIDKIDVLLAEYFGFTDDELDFIINYDIKYRMGRGADDGSDDGEE